MKGKFTLKSTSTFREINASSTNKSKSKATYSFSKSPRFSLKKPECPHATYDGEEIRRKGSGTSIGYGKKSDFTKDLTVSPAATKYNLKTSFEENEQRKRGYSLRKGREEVQYDSYVDKEICKTPSANRYNNEGNFKSKAPIYSMRRKTKVLDKSMTIDNQNINPGPGTYQNPQLELGSKASRFSRISYSASKSQRFFNAGTFAIIIDNKVPGVGKYKDISNLSKVGKYIVSVHRGGTNAKFDVERRKTRFDEAATSGKERPGPGDYKSPSEFGQYDGNVYDRFNTINVPSRTRKK